MDHEPSFIKKLLKTPMLIVFIVICLVFLPNVVNMPSISFRTGLVTALGIDTLENGDVSVLAVINVSSTSESLAENSKIIKASGTSLSDAIDNVNIQYGRITRLGHLRFIMMGEEFGRTNVVNSLDRIIRTNKVRNTVQLFMTSDNIDEMFNVGVQLKSETGIKLSDIICYRRSYSTTSINSNVDAFFKGYYSTSKISKINYVSLTDDINKGINPSSDVDSGISGGTGATGGEQGASGEDSAGGTSGSKANLKKKYISNLGSLAIFKSGVFQMVVEPEVSLGANWLNPSYVPKELKVERMEDLLSSQEKEGFNSKNEYITPDTQMFFDVLSKNVILETFVHKGVPCYAVKLVIKIDLDEIINNNEKIVPLNSSIIDTAIKSRIGRAIRSDIVNTLNISRQSKLDILDLINTFRIKNKGEFNKFLNEGHTVEDFLDRVQLHVDVYLRII